MTLPLENKHVERILSLIVILYGLRLVIPNVLELFFYVQDSGNVAWTVDALSYIIAGCLLIVFFARIVQAVGYFATEGENRSDRRWFLNEILAIPVILFAFTEFLYVFFQGVVCSIACFYPYQDFYGIWQDWNKNLVRFPWLFLYFAVATAILFHARRIAAWLLRLVER